MAVLVAAGETHAATYYVAPSGNDANAGTSWAAPKQTIQAAIDLTVSNDVVLVSNGVYNTGGRYLTGMVSNRVAITNAVTVQSVNGPAVTTIVGVSPAGSNAMRCVYVGTNARLAGFTLTNGATLTAGVTLEISGGGAAAAASGVISNCWISGCTSVSFGGGVYNGVQFNCRLTGNTGRFGGGSAGGSLFNCIISNNVATANGGGVSQAIAADCLVTGNRAPGTGGGISGGQASNCVVSFNRSGSLGGGIYNATRVHNCAIFGNTAALQGGGVNAGQVRNCTIVGNAANEGGGIYSATVLNTIVYDNAASFGANIVGSIVSNSCTVPLAPGLGNFTNAPQLASARDLSTNSPAFRTGNSSLTVGFDFDGEGWASPPSLGCDELYPGAITGGLRALPWVAYTNVAVGFDLAFIADATGRVARSVWNFGDGTVLTNRAAVTRAFAAPGTYPVTLTVFNETFPVGVTETVTVQVAAQTVHYVRPANAGAAALFTSWTTAATNIQSAIDAATQAGALVLVSNGTYATGGRIVADALTNRVVVDKPVELRGLNGPAFTSIVGAGPTGAAAVRCVWVGSGAKLSGFTLSGGATAATGDVTTTCSGGGVFGQLPFAVITNCVLTGNAAAQRGGGAMYGLLFNCVFSNNTSGAFGGGASDAYVWDTRFVSNTSDRGGATYVGSITRSLLSGNTALTFGGGAYQGVLSNCVLRENQSLSRGGGANSALLNGCALYRNYAAEGGGGADGGALLNCTVVANRTLGDGGGLRNGTPTNTIIYHNLGAVGANWSQVFDARNSCSIPALPGSNNLTAYPALASVFHLSGRSPCRGAGATNSTTGVDLDGEPWSNPPSIGCDELLPGTATGSLSVAILISATNLGAGGQVTLEADIAGRVTNSVWNFGDGSLATNRPFDSHVFGSTGTFPVVLTAYNDSYPAGVSATVAVQVVASVIHYVNSSNPTPAAPFTSWATAATNIQNAIDAATQVGAQILVTNGNYNTGSTTARGTTPARVAVRAPVIVGSVNGPDVTFITGGSGVRCVYLGTNAQLTGFTLTGGGTAISGGTYDDRHGGGVWLEPTAVISNCIIRNCTCYFGGGGVYGGTVRNSTIANNSAQYGEGGGGFGATFIGCTIASNNTQNLSNSGPGGGVSSCVVHDSTLIANRAGIASLQWGGGAYASELYGCTLRTNYADSGGGVYRCTLSNCVVVGNAATVNGGGLHYSSAVNCTLISNVAVFGGGGAYNGDLTRCDLLFNRTSVGNGGGAYGVSGLYCRVLFNTGVAGGGGFEGAFSSSLFYGNTAAQGGGGYNTEFRNCTVAGNSASSSGGGLYDDSIATIYNSILISNTAPANPNYFASVALLAYNTCSSPTGSAITAAFAQDPRFVDWTATNLRLQVTSPYVNGGSILDAGSALDLDGNPRLVSCNVDLGAYELPVTYDTDCDVLPDWWESLHYGGHTNALASAPAANGVNTVLEAWLADLNPTNPASFFRITAVTNAAPGIALAIQPSSTARLYRVQAATNLLTVPPFWTPVGGVLTGNGATITFAVGSNLSQQLLRTTVEVAP